MSEPSGQTAAWLDLMRAGDLAARQRLIEHACERLRYLTRKMLQRFPGVHRWEEANASCDGSVAPCSDWPDLQHAVMLACAQFDDQETR